MVLTLYNCTTAVLWPLQAVRYILSDLTDLLNRISLKCISHPTETYRSFRHLHRATLGDVTTSRPGIMDFVNRKKWCVLSLSLDQTNVMLNNQHTTPRDAYKKNAGKGQKDAKLAYTAKLREVRGW